jgi:hypothetical protein
MALSAELCPAGVPCSHSPYLPCQSRNYAWHSLLPHILLLYRFDDAQNGRQPVTHQLCQVPHYRPKCASPWECSQSGAPTLPRAYPPPGPPAQQNYRFESIVSLV